MAGITTNTTQTNLTSDFVIPELVAGEANIANLTTQVNQPGLVSVTPTPSLATAATTAELTTASAESASDVTLGKFTRGLDQINASLFEYKQVFKAAADTLLNTEVFKLSSIIEKSDSVNIAELFTSIFNKPVLNSITTADSRYFIANKALVSINTITESKLFNISAVLSDAIIVNVTVDIVNTINKILESAGSVSISDTTTTNTGIQKLNTSIVADVFSRLVSYTRDYIDVTNSSDTSKTLIGLNKLDSVYITSTDSFSRFVAFERNFQDIVTATDDYYGLATVDDEQYATVEKTVTTDILTVSEQQYYLFATTLINSTISLDSTLLTIKKLFSDTLTIASTESIVREPVKNLQDTITSIETKYFDFSKLLQDLTTSNDLPVYYVGKLLENQGTSSEFANFSFNKLSADSLANTEYKNFNSTLLKQDNAIASDQFIRLVNYIRNYFDSANITETSVITIGLNKQDIVNIVSADTFTKFVSFIRDFQDTVSVTDDYYGLATIDDDQYATIGKTLTLEVLKTTDTLETFAEYVRRLVDTGKNAETKTFLIRPLKSDSLISSEIFSALRNFFRDYTDSNIATEIKELLVKTTKSDSIVSTDTLTYVKVTITVYVRNFTDSLITSETFSTLINYIRDYSDNSIITETKVFLIKPTKSDSLTSSESFSTLTSYIKAYSDTSIFTETKAFLIKSTNSDSILSTDTLTYVLAAYTGPTITLTDIIRSTDSGTINNQNYFASSYVTPGYAGTNTTFGG
jgi:hypothetical protein